MTPQEKYVRDLYSGVLRRDGDRPGIESHCRALGTSPSFQDAQRLLSQFTMGSEAGTIRTFRDDTSREQIFGQVISIGSHCITSNVLRKFGLKKWSGPFDWIFSNIDMVVHCIEDKFDKFLDRRYHASVALSQRMSENVNLCDHVYYRDYYGIRFVFNHYDVTLQENYDYYVRCVRRFFTALYGAEKCLLVCVCASVSPQQYFNLYEVVQKFDNVRLLVVEAVPGSNDFGVELIETRGEVRAAGRFYKMSLFGTLGAIDFTSGYDEVLFRAILNQVGAPQVK